MSAVVTYLIEIALPFMIFVGVRGRRAVATGTAFLMMVIAWTGNYGFFNLLTVVLCVPLVDDAVWRRILPSLVFERLSPGGGSVSTGTRRLSLANAARAAVIALVIGVSALTALREVVRTVPATVGGALAAVTAVAERGFLQWSEPTILHWIAPLRTINGYGLFRSMTTERPEIVVEGSRDGQSWIPYEFKWKPVDPARRPGFVAPHMPRLDWQMWFAALGPRRAGPWLEGLMRGLLRGTTSVVGLLENNPFADDPPRRVRLAYYRYRFASANERREVGVWWSREPMGYLTGSISREQLEN